MTSNDERIYETNQARIKAQVAFDAQKTRRSIESRKSTKKFKNIFGGFSKRANAN